MSDKVYPFKLYIDNGDGQSQIVTGIAEEVNIYETDKEKLRIFEPCPPRFEIILSGTKPLRIGVCYTDEPEVPIQLSATPDEDMAD